MRGGRLARFDRRAGHPPGVAGSPRGSGPGAFAAAGRDRGRVGKPGWKGHPQASDRGLAAGSRRAWPRSQGRPQGPSRWGPGSPASVLTACFSGGGRPRRHVPSYNQHAMIGLTGTSRLLRALADETRLRILHLLAQEELSGTDLMEILNMGQSRISTHLALLKEVGLVQDRKAGRRIFYSVAPGPAAGFWESVQGENANAPEFAADAAGLKALRERNRSERRAYF